MMVAGSGKTVLSSVIVEFLLTLGTQGRGNTCVVFAYCRYTEPIPVKDILAALVRQLLERYPTLVWQFVKPFYDHHEQDRTTPSQQDLLQLLQEISRSGVFSKCFYVIDGLDEAPSDTQIDILSALNSIGINFCLTSRPIAAVKDQYLLLPIEKKVERMPALRRLFKDGAVKAELVSTILKRSPGM